MRLFEDVRYAVRQLTNARAFTAVAVLTLALGIAGSTMFFAAVNAMVFRPIRATRSDGLFAVRYIHKLKSHGLMTEAQFKRLAADPPPVAGRIGAMAGMAVPVVVAVPGRAERVDAEIVTAGFLPALDVVPQAGRLLLPEDDEVDAGLVAIISDRLWRQWFGGDRLTAGRSSIAINRQPFTIVGVAPRGFRGLAGSSYGTADIWVTPAAAARAGRGGVPLRTGGYWSTFVRPRADTLPSDVEAAIHSALTNETSTWVAVLVLILAFGITAALRPAMRAARVDPNVALREL